MYIIVTKFHIPYCNGFLVIAIRKIGKYRLCATILLYFSLYR